MSSPIPRRKCCLLGKTSVKRLWQSNSMWPLYIVVICFLVVKFSIHIVHCCYMLSNCCPNAGLEFAFLPRRVKFHCQFACGVGSVVLPTMSPSSQPPTASSTAGGFLFAATSLCENFCFCLENCVREWICVEGGGSRERRTWNFLRKKKFCVL